MDAILKVENVLVFLNRLDTLLGDSQDYQGCTVYGAVAGVQIDESAAQFAEQRGLFVLGRGTDGLIEIQNDLKFKPRNFSR